MNTLRLFDSTAEEFLTNGKGNLTKYAIKPIVHNEVNGEYTLEFDYPCAALHYNDIKDRDIVVTKVSPYSKPQAFRIVNKKTPIDGQASFLANHISYDLSGKILKAPPLPQASTPDVPGSFNSCKDAFSYMSKQENVIGSLGKFTFITDISDETRLDMATPMSIRSFLGSSNDNSIATFYGGELYFDNFTVHHMAQMGIDSGVVVRYGKNMTDFNQVLDSSGVATGVYPYYYQENDGFIDGDVQYVLDDNGNKAFSYDKIMALDCTSVNWDDEGYSDYEGMPTKDMLNKYAAKYVKNNTIGIERVSTTISFKELAKVSGGLSLIHDLEKVQLGDWVTVIYPNVNISLKAECIATEYDAATDTYESITLGDPLETLSGSMVDNFFSVSNTTTNAMKQQNERNTNNFNTKVDKAAVINAINATVETELINPVHIDLDPLCITAEEVDEICVADMGEALPQPTYGDLAMTVEEIDAICTQPEEDS